MKRKSFMKKLLCTCLVTTMSLSLTACGQKTKDTDSNTSNENGTNNNTATSEVKEFSIFAGIGSMSPDNSEKTLIKKMNEAKGIDIKWNCVAGDALTERKNLLFGTGVDLPDAVMGASLSDYELITYGSQGLIVPLNDYINEETMPNLMKLIEKRPNLLATATMPDGKIYGLPSIGEMGFKNSDGNTYYIGAIPQFTAINQEWLNNLGLSMPKTINELHDVLLAFKNEDANGNGDPNDEIPLSFMYDNWCAGMTSLFSAFGFTDYNDQHKVLEDGKVVFNATKDEYKAAYKYFHEWYDEGLIDIEVFSQDASQYIAKGKNADPIIGVFSWWEIPEVVGYDRADMYTYLPFLTDDNGYSKVNLNEQGTTGHSAFSITKACKDPKTLLSWVDQLYDPYMSMQSIYGPIGEFFAEQPDANGVYVTRELKEGESEGELKGKLELYGPNAQLAEDFGSIYYMEDRAQQRLDDLRDFWFKNVNNFEYYPSVTFTIEETEIINDKLPDIQTYVSETSANWLKNGGIDEEWDAYKEQLDQMGLQDVIKCWQDAYDRYVAASK
jgi:putative aldouronate transport system substrate-binding protein